MAERERVRTRTPQVGVFVNADTTYILSMAKKHVLSTVQLHGQEGSEQIDSLRLNGIRVIKAISVGVEFPSAEIEYYAPFCDMMLLDTKGKLPGGSGQTFDWSNLEYYPSETPFLLSGGIRPEHANAIKAIDHPYFKGVDINSGFENTPGEKNIDSIKQFIHDLREE
jgi:phosphoribosylanthranilate isomerase